MGPVARGGLRWSDRRDDFRTEVLGLVKAQQVKNAVIVPVGSKGGFFPKRLPRGGSAGRDPGRGNRRLQDLPAAACLDLTDNLLSDGDDRASPIGHRLRLGRSLSSSWRRTRGQQRFPTSPTVSLETTGFGSTTPLRRAALPVTTTRRWPSRPVGLGKGSSATSVNSDKDIQRETVTVVGVGDMSGDVFGNGMLLSKTLKLRAAFDHRHIFLDPDARSGGEWAERKRHVRSAAFVLAGLRSRR